MSKEDVSAAVVSLETVNAKIVELAALSPLEYDQQRETTAKSLKVRVATLDREVQALRDEQRIPDGQNTSAMVDEPEPWDRPVDGCELLEEIRSALIRHVVLPDGAAEALSLWIAGTYAFDAFRIWPKLALTSPEKRCGKTTLLTGVIGPLSYRSLVASNITPAAVFRVIEAWRPTLLIDEADTFLHGNDELRGVINSGHTKSGAFVVRVTGDDHTPTKFSTWAPMAIAMIKSPPGTILDRSIVIQLRRRLPGELVDKIPLDFEDRSHSLRRRALRWGLDNLELLKNSVPALPPSGNDRAIDNWTPLFAIANAIGGDWPEKTAAAFVALTAGLEDDDAVGPMILEDIQRVFDESGARRLHSVDLVSALVELEERPWSEWKHGKPMSSTSLARLLRPFRVKSKQLRIGVVNRHGYELQQFADAFDRYLSSTLPTQSATPLQPNSGAGFSGIENATPIQDVALQEPRKPSDDAGCSGVAFQNGGTEEEGEL